MRFRLFAVFAGSFLVIAGQSVRAAGPMVVDSELQSVSLTRLWEARLPLPAGDAVTKGYLLDDSLYVMTSGGIVFAVQPETGLIRWGEKLGERGLLIDRPTHARTTEGNGPLLLPVAGTLYIVDRYTGQLEHRVQPPFPLTSPVLGWGQVLFAGGSEPQFHAWIRSERNPESLGKLWTVATSGATVVTPVFHGSGKILIATEEGLVYSLGAADKSLDWAYRVGGAVIADPFIDSSGVFVASKDRSLYKLNVARGFLLWRARLPDPLTEGPLVAAQTVFQYCERTGLVALDSGTGREKWRHEGARSFVTHTPQRDLLHTTDGRLLAVDHETGRVLASASIPAVLEVLPNLDEDTVFLIGSDGAVVSARGDGTPYLRRQQVLAARERLNLPPGPRRTGDGNRTRSASGTEADDPDPFRSRRDEGP